MSVFRVEKSREFTVIANCVFKDKWEDMTDFQPDRIFDRLDALTVTPEKAGYVPYDQVVEAFGKTAADFLTDWKHDNG